MSATVRYLNRRFALAALALLVPAALATGASLVAQYNEDVRTRYIVVFERMGAELARLDIELARIAIGEKAPDDTEAAQRAYREALRIYAAIRSVDEDGVAEGPDGRESGVPAELSRIADILGIDVLRDSEELGLRGHRMPRALDAIWEKRDAAEEPGALISPDQPEAFETIVGEMLLQAAPVVLGASLGGADGRVEAARVWSLEQTATNERLRAIDTILDNKAMTLSAMPMALTVLVFFASLVGVAIAYAGAFLPLRSHVTKLERSLLTEAENAREAERAKSEFLANMSHEIRTPMNGVMGMAELLSNTKLDQRQAMYVDVVANSAKSLLEIINDILDFSKIDAGHIEIERKALRLCEVADQSARLLAKAAYDKNLELMVRIDPRLPAEILGDAGRMRQVTTNLLGNAVKFTERGEVVLDLSLERTGEDGDAADPRLRIDVRDTGVGIPQDKLKTVFGKFTQVDGSATRAHEGTGLGLAITKGLVELMGGRLSARSEPGVGSIFSASLPLIAAENQGPVRAIDGLSDKRALVVDDNPTSRRILVETLCAWRMDAAAASGGREALRLLAAAKAEGRAFDLVLLDEVMPAMNGADVLSQIRSDPELARTPVILLSSVGAEPASGAEAHGEANAAVSKPVSRAALHEQISALSAAARMEALEPKPAPSAAEGDAFEPAAEPHGEIEAEGVLIVEDNRINRLVALQMLGTLGIDAAVAEDGREGVRAFRRLRPRLILMDVSMPLMNGLDATRNIREIEAANGLRPCHIVGLTAHAMEGDRRKCLEAGMDDYLAKPVSIERLSAVVSTIGLGLDDDEGTATPPGRASS